MIEKIRRWFAGIGAAFGKRDKPLPASAEPRPETGTDAAARETGTATRRVARVRPPRVPPAAAAPPPAVDRPVADVETTTDDDDEAGVDAQAGEHVVAQAGAQTSAPARAPQTSAAAPPAQEEIRRRRELVRSLFNDFWSGRDDKPAAFVDRLDEAETYLNERLSASGEPWRLDAGTRKLLGLPPRHSGGEGGAAHH